MAEAAAGVQHVKYSRRAQYNPSRILHRKPPQLGFATFLGSVNPVSGSWYSLQLTGTMSLPASLAAIMTPSSLDAVDK